MSSGTRATVLRYPAWLTPNVRVLCGVSFLQDAASELLYPILPIFLTVTLGAPVAVVGAAEGVAEGVAAITKLAAGRLADRRARRPLIWIGYGLAAIGKLLIAVATVWPVVLAGRCVDRVGKGVRGAPRDALLMVGADPAARGRIFGAHRAADTAGAVVGPAIGLGLYELLDHQIRPLLVIAVLPAVLSVVLVRAVREGPLPAAPSRRAGCIGERGGVPALQPAPLPGRLRALIVVLAAFSLVNFPDALLLLRAHELGLSTAGVIGAYVLYNAVYAAAAIRLGPYPTGPHGMLCSRPVWLFSPWAISGWAWSAHPGGCLCCCRCMAASQPALTASARRGSLTPLLPAGKPAPKASTRDSPELRSSPRGCGPGSPGEAPDNCPCWSPGSWRLRWRSLC